MYISAVLFHLRLSTWLMKVNGTLHARSARDKFLSSPVSLAKRKIKKRFSRNVNGCQSLYCYFLFFFLGTAIFSGSTIQYKNNFLCTWNEQLLVDRTKQSIQGWVPCSLCVRKSRKPPEKFRNFKAYTKNYDKRSITAQMYFHLPKIKATGPTAHLLPLQLNDVLG